MKRLLATILTMIIMVMSAQAQIVTSAEVKNEVAKILEKSYKNLTSGDHHYDIQHGL